MSRNRATAAVAATFVDALTKTRFLLAFCTVFLYELHRINTNRTNESVKNGFHVSRITFYAPIGDFGTRLAQPNMTQF